MEFNTEESKVILRTMEVLVESSMEWLPDEAELVDMDSLPTAWNICKRLGTTLPVIVYDEKLQQVLEGGVR